MTWLRRLSTRVPAAKGLSRDPSTTTSLHASKYPELSRLPKAPKVRSIRFKRTNPGSVSHLNFTTETTPVIDPAHPIAHLRPRQLLRVVPHYHCALFGAHAYPQAVLRKFEIPDQMIQFKDKDASHELADIIARQTGQQKTGQHMMPPPQGGRGSENNNNNVVRPVVSPVVSVGDRRRAVHTVPMSLMIVTSKKLLHKSGALRTKIKLRIKEALSLVAIRGACSHGGLEGGIVLSTPEGIGGEGRGTRKSIILQGWTYVIRPSLEAYRCPWPLLLGHLRRGLLEIQSHAVGLEEKWGKGSRQGELPRDMLSQQKAGNRQRSNPNSHVRRIRTSRSSNNAS